MYEHMTYETILNRMLDKIPSNMDKREGSIIYDALAPCAIEMQLMYIELDVILKETFGDTASREYLIRRASERGLTPYYSTYAILKAEFNMEVPIGSRFSLNDFNYIIIEKILGYEYQIQCETLGSEGNRYFGDIIPIDYIKGLTIARITEILIPAQDDEDTEDFRERYLNSFSSQAFGGNVADYLAKTNSISGVGSTKVTPVWNGGGTVKLTILDAEFNKATDTLIELVQETIDPNKDSSGVGLAPIGHVVTVDTVDEIEINISTSIVNSSSVNIESIKTEVTQLINQYLYDLRKEWDTEDNIVIRIAVLESVIMSITGVVDISNTSINNMHENVNLNNNEIPILGVISYG